MVDILQMIILILYVYYMTKLPPTCLKDKIVGKFSVKIHIKYILLETSCIDLHIGDVSNNSCSILTQIFTFLFPNTEEFHNHAYVHAVMAACRIFCVYYVTQSTQKIQEKCPQTSTKAMTSLISVCYVA